MADADASADTVEWESDFDIAEVDSDNAEEENPLEVAAEAGARLSIPEKTAI